MNKRFKIVSVISILILCCVLCVGCIDGEENEKVEVDFVRFNMGKRQTDYYLDFTVELSNNTKYSSSFETDDFYIEVNGNKIDNVTLMYEYEEIVYAAYVSVDSGDTLKIRVRAISAINNQQRNSIILKYKDKTLVDDQVYIRDTNK